MTGTSLAQEYVHPGQPWMVSSRSLLRYITRYRSSKVVLTQAYVVSTGGKLEPAEQLLVTMLPLDFNMGVVL